MHHLKLATRARYQPAIATKVSTSLLPGRPTSMSNDVWTVSFALKQRWLGAVFARDGKGLVLCKSFGFPDTDL